MFVRADSPAPHRTPRPVKRVRITPYMAPGAPRTAGALACTRVPELSTIIEQLEYKDDTRVDLAPYARICCPDALTVYGADAYVLVPDEYLAMFDDTARLATRIFTYNTRAGCKFSVVVASVNGLQRIFHDTMWFLYLDASCYASNVVEHVVRDTLAYLANENGPDSVTATCVAIARAFLTEFNAFIATDGHRFAAQPDIMVGHLAIIGLHSIYDIRSVFEDPAIRAELLTAPLADTYIAALVAPIAAY